MIMVMGRLLRRGWEDEDIKKVIGHNALRDVRQVIGYGHFAEVQLHIESAKLTIGRSCL
ncbi:MAG: hypothetical protein J7J76_07960 [Candidatus Latescibacteria bacterium]|nr:hypothetical protein [Candidatus Latescibacterota bacterium]